MTKKLVAIVGSYRKGGAIDSAVDAVLAGAEEKGAETKKIYLIEKNIEFCRNCRTCTQEPGEQRGKCKIEDELEEVLSEAEAADAIVVAAPVNYWNVTAIFRRFLERLVGYAYWPWGKAAPVVRSKKTPRKAALISSSAMPGILLPIATGAPKALAIAARSLGAKPVAKLWMGLVSREEKPQLSKRTLHRARVIGARLVS